VEDEPYRTDADSIQEALAAGRVHAVVHPPSALGAQVAVLTTTTHIEVFYNGGLDSSVAARSRVLEAIADWRRSIVEERLHERGLTPAFTVPVEAVPKDMAPKGALLGRLLAFILVVSSLMGAFYPAIDLGAGEKERGTLETLLLAPAQRIEIAVG